MPVSYRQATPSGVTKTNSFLFGWDSSRDQNFIQDGSLKMWSLEQTFPTPSWWKNEKGRVSPAFSTHYK